MATLGLKLWSTNNGYVRPAKDLYADQVYDYLELFVVPGSESQAGMWKNTGLPFILHAPHSYVGLNFSQSGELEANRKALRTLDNYARELRPRYIIFHPGLNGPANETIRQMQHFREEFPLCFKNALVENKPALGLQGEVCVGSTPGEIARIMAATAADFCLDFGHGFCAAAANRVDPLPLCAEFLRLEPRLFHLSDGRVSSREDLHLNLGDGDFDLAALIRMMPGDAMVSLETRKSSGENLDDFIRDVSFFKRTWSENH